MEIDQFRQGDVLVERINSLPQNLVEAKEDKNRIVLQFGEVTGHAHAIYTPEKVNVFLSQGTPTSLVEGMEGGREGFLEVLERSYLKHEEHSAITLEPGIYKVTRQRQYTPEALRFVND